MQKLGLLFFALLVFHNFCQAKEQHRVIPIAGLACRMHLFQPDTKTKIILAYQNGTGIYSTEAIEESPPYVLPLFQKSRAAVLSIDKPGITLVEGKAQHSDQYLKFTQNDLLNCWSEAFQWAAREVEDAKFIFLGHSEGAQIVSRFVERLTDEQIRAYSIRLILTSTPLDRWMDIVRFQTAELPEYIDPFMQAIRMGNDNWLLENGEISSLYLKDSFDLEPLSQTLGRLLKRGVEINMFHGLFDRHVPAISVESFRNAHRKNPTLHVWLFESGHTLGTTANKDIERRIMEIIEEP